MRRGELKQAVVANWRAVRQAWDLATVAQGLLVLVPPAWTTWIGVRLAMDQGANPLSLFLVGVALFLAVALAQSLFRPLPLRIGSAVVVVLLATAFYIWAVDQYRLEFDGVQLSITPVMTSYAPSAQKIKVGIRLKNPQHFPLYWTSRLRLVSADGKVGEDSQSEWGGMIEGLHSDRAVMSDGEIPLNIPNLLAMTKPLDGQIYFIVCYGRKESDQHKSLVVRGTIHYVLDMRGRMSQPIVAEESGPQPKWPCP